MREQLFDKLERESLKIASVGKRAIAYLIDNIIIAALILIIHYDQLMSASDNVEVAQILGNFVLETILLHFFYQGIFISLYGASLGKMLLKLLVLNDSVLDKPNLAQSFVRAGVRQLSDMAFGLGFLWAFSNDLRKTWQDYLARTIVVDVA